MKKIILIFTALTFMSALSFAQRRNKKADSPKAKVEQSLLICDDIPFRERMVLGVADFIVTASYAGSKIGTGMSDMLSNALVECNCFRVVERERLNKIRQEQQLSGVDPAKAAKVSRLIGAQLLVMGNITEFKEKSGGVGGVLGGRIGSKFGVGGIGKTDAHVGMIIKVVDATTGDIILSKSLERKVSKVGALGGGLFPIPMGGGFYKSKAMEDAIEETILEAVALIVNKKDDFSNMMYDEPVAEFKSANISVRNADFKSLMTLAKYLEGLSYVKKVDKKLEGNTAHLTVAYAADQEALLMDLVDIKGLPMDIDGFNETSIDLVLK